MAGTQKISCGHSQLPTLIGLSKPSVSRARFFRITTERKCGPSTVCQSKGQSYHVEVEVSEDEDPEGVYKRFRNSCNLSGMVYEARRRKFFENTQDIKKRKQQEKGLRKSREARERFLQTFDDAHTDTPPFSELFAGEEDIYSVLGDASYDEGLGQEKGSEDRPSRQNGRTNGVLRTPDNVVMRSVPSQGPKANQEPSKSKGNGKPKSHVQTARTRRAAKQRAAQATQRK